MSNNLSLFMVLAAVFTMLFVSISSAQSSSATYNVVFADSGLQSQYLIAKIQLSNSSLTSSVNVGGSATESLNLVPGTYTINLSPSVTTGTGYLFKNWVWTAGSGSSGQTTISNMYSNTTSINIASNGTLTAVFYKIPNISVSLLASNVTLDFGQEVTFTAPASGGFGNYNIEWGPIAPGSNYVPSYCGWLPKSAFQYPIVTFSNRVTSPILNTTSASGVQCTEEITITNSTQGISPAVASVQLTLYPTPMATTYATNTTLGTSGGASEESTISVSLDGGGSPELQSGNEGNTDWMVKYPGSSTWSTLGTTASSFSFCVNQGGECFTPYENNQYISGTYEFKKSITDVGTGYTFNSSVISVNVNPISPTTTAQPTYKLFFQSQNGQIVLNGVGTFDNGSVDSSLAIGNYEVTAIPNAGYAFKQWLLWNESGDAPLSTIATTLSNPTTLQLADQGTPSPSGTLQAIFQPSGSAVPLELFLNPSNIILDGGQEVSFSTQLESGSNGPYNVAFSVHSGGSACDWLPQFNTTSLLSSLGTSAVSPVGSTEYTCNYLLTVANMTTGEILTTASATLTIYPTPIAVVHVTNATIGGSGPKESTISVTLNGGGSPTISTQQIVWYGKAPGASTFELASIPANTNDVPFYSTESQGPGTYQFRAVITDSGTYKSPYSFNSSIASVNIESASSTNYYSLTMKGPYNPYGSAYYVTPEGGTYSLGDRVSIGLNNLPSDLIFKGWIGTGYGSYTGPNEFANVTMDGNITEYANYYPTSIGLSVNSTDGGIATISPPNTSGYACWQPKCTYYIPYNYSATLTAHPQIGYTFSRWDCTYDGYACNSSFVISGANITLPSQLYYSVSLTPVFAPSAPINACNIASTLGASGAGYGAPQLSCDGVSVGLEYVTNESGVLGADYDVYVNNKLYSNNWVELGSSFNVIASGGAVRVYNLNTLSAPISSASPSVLYGYASTEIIPINSVSTPTTSNYNINFQVTGISGVTSQDQDGISISNSSWATGYSSGASATLANGQYNIYTFTTIPGYTFKGWEWSSNQGSSQVINSASNPATLNLAGTGTLTAVYEPSNTTSNKYTFSAYMGSSGAYTPTIFINLTGNGPCFVQSSSCILESTNGTSFIGSFPAGTNITLIATHNTGQSCYYTTSSGDKIPCSAYQFSNWICSGISGDISNGCSNVRYTGYKNTDALITLSGDVQEVASLYVNQQSNEYTISQGQSVNYGPWAIELDGLGIFNSSSISDATFNIYYNGSSIGVESIIPGSEKILSNHLNSILSVLSINLTSTYPGLYASQKIATFSVDAFNLSTSPMSATINQGQTILLTASVPGSTGSYTYTWYNETNGNSGDGKYMQSGSTLNILGGQVGTFEYDVCVSSNSGMLIQNDGEISSICTVQYPIAITVNPSNTPITTTVATTTTIVPTSITSTIIPPAPPSTIINYNVSFKPGWNLFSVPVNYVTNINYNEPNACNQNDFNGGPFTYSNGEYVNSYNIYGGVGYFVYDNTACNIDFEGPAMSKNTSLSKGWNIFGVASATQFSAIEGNCNIVSGPFSYDQSSNAYYSATSLVPGVGYFVYVGASCTLTQS